MLFVSEHNRVSNDSASEGRELVVEPILCSIHPLGLDGPEQAVGAVRCRGTVRARRSMMRPFLALRSCKICGLGSKGVSWVRDLFLAARFCQTTMAIINKTSNHTTHLNSSKGNHTNDDIY